MFIDAILKGFVKREDIAGIIINPDSEGVVIDKEFMR